MEFEWDENKNQINIEKHNISFVAASQFLKTGNTFIKKSSYEIEERYIAIGFYKNRFIAVIYTMRGDTFRIISARAARRNEREEYEQERRKDR